MPSSTLDSKLTTTRGLPVNGALAGRTEIVWKNTKVGFANDFDRPQDFFLDGVAGLTGVIDAANLAVPFRPKGLPYIDFYHHIAGTTAPAVPVVAYAYGWHPVGSDFPLDLITVNAAFDSFSHITNIGLATPAEQIQGRGLPGFWAPLLRGDGTQEIKFTATTTQCRKTRTDSAGRATMTQYNNNWVYAGGAEIVLVIVKTPDTAITAGVLLAQART